jgi:hypothetical protein
VLQRDFLEMSRGRWTRWLGPITSFSACRSELLVALHPFLSNVMLPFFMCLLASEIDVTSDYSLLHISTQKIKDSQNCVQSMFQFHTFGARGKD